MDKKMTPERKALAESNLRLVYFIMSKMSVRQTDEDAFGAGCLGLCKAAAAWTQKGGIAFSTFACHLIRHEIIDNLERERSGRLFSRTPLESAEPFLSVDENGYQTLENRDLLNKIYQNKEKLLSCEELSVLRMLAQGKTISQIAEEFKVSSATIYIIRKSAAKKIKDRYL